MTDALRARAPLDAAPAAAGSRGTKRKEPAATLGAQLALTTSARGAAVNGAGSPAVGASRSAAQQKRGKSGEGSAEGTGSARGPHVTSEERERLSVLAETIRQELIGAGVPSDQLVSRSIPFRGNPLPNFPVVRSGSWARLSAASLAEAVLYTLRDQRMAPCEGLRNAMVKGSYFFDKFERASS